MPLVKCLLGLSLLFSVTSYGATWVEIYRDDKFVLSYDKDTVKIKRLGNGQKYLEVWVEYTYSKPEIYHTTQTSFNTITFIKALGKYYLDCTNNKLGAIQNVYYDTEGDVVKSNSYYISTNSSATWEEAVPSSVGEGIIKTLCSTYRNQLR